MKSSDIRTKFINFFKSKDHKFVPGSPVVLPNDPTLLFANAGMNQFKDVFLGKGDRPYTRAVNSQPCIRVSGKHNDLEEVGLDTYHQTLFEMLGNWSFGDYYKKEAIVWAWELFTKVFNLPKEKLYATVFETDDESFNLWQKETDINNNQILRCGKKDNFWEMAETGPCGPCSEIHIDRGPAACDKKDTPSHKCEINGNCARYVELWNLVFIQYDRQTDGSLKDLPKKHVDTGAGLERIAAYLQNTCSNYETDLFQPIIQKIVKITNKPYEGTINGMPHRVMADHIRTLVFAIADNVRPGNDGRGYVLRRILRRALMYAQKLDVHKPILFKLVAPVLEIMADFYPHLKERKEYIENLIKAEEESFLKTLDQGLRRFEETAEKVIKANKIEIPGEEAFKLYDTFGFPVDLTQVLAREKGLTVEINVFQMFKEEQQKRSRQAHAKKLLQKASERAAKLKPGQSITYPELDKILNLGVYTDEPGGGEASIPTSDEALISMARHHTVTHLLHKSLKEVLGDHITQAGSLVDINRLRFDFTHFKALSPQEVQKVEDLVNNKINEQIPVIIHPDIKIDEAKAMGAVAIFGEKYEERVRIVDIKAVSKELCGGTHVKNTNIIEKFKIITETAISAGTRRIEALAGKENIQNYFKDKKDKLIKILESKSIQLEKLINEIQSLDENFPESIDLKDLEKLEYKELDHALEKTINLIKKAEKHLSKHKSKKAGSETHDLSAKIKLIPNTDISILSQFFQDYDIGVLRNISDNLINRHKNLIVLLGSTKAGKGFFLVKLSPTLINKYNANDLVKKLTSIAGGGGGGRPDMAQAGGAKKDMVEQALSMVEAELLNK